MLPELPFHNDSPASYASQPDERPFIIRFLQSCLDETVSRIGNVTAGVPRCFAVHHIVLFAIHKLDSHQSNRSAVAPFRCLTAMPSERSTRARIPPSCPKLDKASREVEVGFEPWTFWTLEFDREHAIDDVSYVNNNSFNNAFYGRYCEHERLSLYNPGTDIISMERGQIRQTPFLVTSDKNSALYIFIPECGSKHSPCSNVMNQIHPVCFRVMIVTHSPSMSGVQISNSCTLKLYAPLTASNKSKTRVDYFDLSSTEQHHRSRKKSVKTRMM
ncbi:hypothetical protein T265_04475 [Opisthorchis viverrini]|uniref:Uncharacterized protein n=1 Tax=Opisthorchis viverrini TaxID=6198 RepID=A0A074ZSI5_OPIVI|nr:hypothetical protein T265_04475 [Opisthorchis viverrini]KER28787.1 hypothetical protein T265_04475 [Opisthorchis viverrini]